MERPEPWDKICDSFDDMNLRESLLRGIYAYGFEKPNGVQMRAVEPFNPTSKVAMSLSTLSLGKARNPRTCSACSRILTSTTCNARRSCSHQATKEPRGSNRWLPPWAIVLVLVSIGDAVLRLLVYRCSCRCKVPVVRSAAQLCLRVTAIDIVKPTAL